MEVEEARKRRPFKFANVLTNLKNFPSIIENHWDGNAPLYVSTSAMFRFSKILKDLKPKLRQLGKEALGDLPKRTKEALSDLCLKQEHTLNDPQPDFVREEAEAYEKWRLLSEMEEQFLNQRSKLH